MSRNKSMNQAATQDLIRELRSFRTTASDSWIAIAVAEYADLIDELKSLDASTAAPGVIASETQDLEVALAGIVGQLATLATALELLLTETREHHAYTSANTPGRFDNPKAAAPKGRAS